MRVKVTLGSVKYDGVVCQEGKEFDIRPEDFKWLENNVEVVEDESAAPNDSQKNKDEAENPEEEIKSLSDLNLEDLKAIAKAEKIEGYSKLNKAELVEEIAKNRVK